MKDKLKNVDQVDLNFCKTIDWLNSKRITCENCGSSCTSESHITACRVPNKPIYCICKSCGIKFIENGAIDIQHQKTKNDFKKEKLIQQAKRLGYNFNRRYTKPEYDITIQELKKIILSLIKSERNRFNTFLNLSADVHEKIKKITDAINKQSSYTSTCYQTWISTSDIFYEYDTHENYQNARWISYFDATKRIGDIVLEYTWATCNGDNSIEDQGFEIMDVWEDLTITDYEDTITDTQRINWLQSNYNFHIDEDLRKFIDNKIKQSIK
jgi:hypothetical protein